MHGGGGGGGGELQRYDYEVGMRAAYLELP